MLNRENFLHQRIKLAKSEAITAINTVEEVKAKTGKDKVIVSQPFGRGVQVQGEYIIDTSSRSFHQSYIVDIINNLRKDYGVIIMSEFQFPVDTSEDQVPVAWLKQIFVLGQVSLNVLIIS